jgi:hypothetical protein
MSILAPTAEENSSDKSFAGPENHARRTEESPNPDSSYKVFNNLPPPPPPFPLTKTSVEYAESLRGQSSSRAQEKSGETAHSDSSHHKKGKLFKSPKSHSKKLIKDHSKANDKSTESLSAAIQNHETNSARRAAGMPVETPVKTAGHDRSAKKTHTTQNEYFYSPIRQTVKPKQSTSSSLRPQNSNIRATKATEIVPEGTVSGHLRRIAASEPGQPSGLRVPQSRRLSKTTYGDTIRKKAWESSQQVINQDPLSRISHEEDEASLAALARVMESEEMSTEVHESPTKKDHLSRISQEENEASLVTLAQANQSEEKNADKKDALSRVSHEEDLTSLVALSRALDSQESSTGSDDPPKAQDSSSSTRPAGQNAAGPPAAPFLVHMVTADSSKTPVRPTLDPQMPSHELSPAKPSPSRVPRSHGGVLDKISIRPRGSSVKALAARFNKPESAPTFGLSPTKSPTKPTVSPTRTNESPRRESIVAPYTRNTPSPAKSQRSGKSEKTPKSVRNTGQVERHIQFGSKPTVEPKSSPAKNTSPRRVLKSSLSDSTPLRRVEKSFDSIKSTSSFTVNALNPFAVSLKHVTAAPAMEVPVDYAFDGPSGKPNTGGDLSIPELSPGERQVQLMRPTTSGATDMTHNQRPDSVLERVIAISSPLFSPPLYTEDKDLSLNRSNSLLYSQIVSLQTQISRKNEALRKLKQQLDTRDSLEFGTLSEQLRGTKKELRMWKTRAEVAEKQVELLSKVPTQYSRMTSIRRHARSTGNSPSMQQSSVDYDDSSKTTERIRKSLHGMDGAGSSEWNSEESNETVIREIRHAVTGSEYDIWREQTMNDLGSTSPQKLE